jgi:CDP-2,3-bis-(O-geranylgeranyl)-sn-glycerol synthase
MTMIPATWIFISPTEGASGWTANAFFLGTFLGFTSLVGDSTGSFFKRRKGMKREGDVSSKAPLLDTLPFAISVFVFGQIFLTSAAHGDRTLLLPMALLIGITPILHRSFNLIGYKIGWKDVPY